jgi:hypothetical protein
MENNNQQTTKTNFYPSPADTEIVRELITNGLSTDLAREYGNRLQTHGVSNLVLMHSLTEQDCNMMGITNPDHIRSILQGGNTTTTTTNDNDMNNMPTVQVVGMSTTTPEPRTVIATIVPPNNNNNNNVPSTIPIAIPVAEFVTTVYQSTVHHPTYGRFQRNYPVKDDQITAFGGNICCCCGDCEICCYTSCCPCCQLVETMTNANELNYCGNCFLIYCIPCWYPCGTACQASNINKSLGGKSQFWRHCCFASCLGPIWICYISRAVKQARLRKAFPFQQPQGAPVEVVISR